MSEIEVKYPICCGADIHKNLIVATIVTTDSKRISEYQTKSFTCLNTDIQAFHDWLIKNNCKLVCMESTGKYWIPIFNLLEKDIDVRITHPKYVRAIKGKKTDVKDSKWIADLFKCDLIKSSFIPPKDFRQMREIARYRFKLVCMRSSEKNRLQNCMTVSNIGIDKLLSDPFGGTATEIISYLLEHTAESLDPKAVKKLIKKNVKASSEDIIKAIKGYKIESDQQLKFNLAQNHLDYLEQMIIQTEVELYARTAPYQSYVNYLATMPGITPLAAMIILAEIGVNMDVFQDSKNLTSWCGLAPACNESANKKKSTKIAKAGAYLKPLMVQCALAAIRSKKQPYFANKYYRIKKRRGHKKAIIAIARMMMTCIYHMVANSVTFNPGDYEKIVNPQKGPKKVELNSDNVMAWLSEQGYDINSLVKH